MTTKWLNLPNFGSLPQSRIYCHQLTSDISAKLRVLEDISTYLSNKYAFVVNVAHDTNRTPVPNSGTV